MAAKAAIATTTIRDAINELTMTSADRGSQLCTVCRGCGSLGRIGYCAWHGSALGVNSIDQEERPLGTAQKLQNPSAFCPGEPGARIQAPLTRRQQKLPALV